MLQKRKLAGNSQEGEIPVVVENHEVMPEGTCRDEAID
jgi:hypothetical protein